MFSRYHRLAVNDKSTVYHILKWHGGSCQSLLIFQAYRFIWFQGSAYPQQNALKTLILDTMPLPVGLVVPSGDQSWRQRRRVLILQRGKRNVGIAAKWNAGVVYGLVASLSLPRLFKAILISAIVTDTPFRPSSVPKLKCQKLIIYPDDASQDGLRPT